MLTSEVHWFVDDSGSEPQGVVFVLAGFLAPAAAWANLSNEWQAALELPPRLDYFKMSEAATLRGQFARYRGWDDEKRDARVRKLTHIVREHVAHRISASVQHEHWGTYMRSLPAVGRTLSTDTPYSFLFMRLVTEHLVFAYNRGIRSTCDMVMDEQTGVEAEVLEQWPQFRDAAIQKRADLGALLGARPYFLDDKQFLPLQAADLYAWHVRNHLMAARGSGPGRILRMLAKVPSRHKHITKADLIVSNERLVNFGRELMAANPFVRLVEFPPTRLEQKKARRAYRRERGLPPTPRGSRP